MSAELSLPLEQETQALTTPPVDKLGEQHHKMVDWMLVNYTGKNLKAMAETFNYTQPWLSSIINTDLFRAELAKRRALINGHMHQRLVEKTAGVASAALDKLQKVLDEDDEELDPRFVLDSADKALARLGFAPTRPPVQEGQVSPTSGTNTVYIVPSELLQQAHDRIKQRAALANGLVVEGEGQ